MRFAKFSVVFVGITVATFIVSGYGSTVSAHRDGCHRWHSCPSDSGSYVCGDLGYTSECVGTEPSPTSRTTTSPPPPAPIHSPVIKTKTLTAYSDIAIPIEYINDAREYPGYEKLMHDGKQGKKKVDTIVTYTDGVESSRQVQPDVITTSAISKLITKGTRTHSDGRFSWVNDAKPGWFNHNKGKYNIEGFYKPLTHVAITLDKRQLATATTNKDGYFRFENIKAPNKAPWLELFEQKDGNTKSVSEKTKVNLDNKQLVEEYDLLHRKNLN